MAVATVDPGTTITYRAGDGFKGCGLEVCCKSERPTVDARMGASIERNLETRKNWSCRDKGDGFVCC